MASREALLSPAGAPSLLVDEALNDSDKTFVVPAGSMYDIAWVYVELTTTADVGNRLVMVEIQDSKGDVVAQVSAAAVQAASLSHEYTFGQGLTQYDSGDATKHHLPLPRLVLPQFFKLRVYDATAVAATADDMNVQLMCSCRFSGEAVPAPKILLPDVATLTLTGQAPAGGDWIEIAPAKGDLTITGQTPVTGGNTVITPAVSTPSISVSAPTVGVA